MRYDACILFHIAFQQIDEWDMNELQGLFSEYNEMNKRQSSKAYIRKPTQADLDIVRRIKG